MANPTAPKPARAAKPKTLSPNGYVSAVLRMRDAQRQREVKLLERVPEPDRALAKAMLAKLDGG